MTAPEDLERTEVRPIRIDDTPAAWGPSLRLIDQLREIFPDQILDIAEIPPNDSQEA